MNSDKLKKIFYLFLAGLFILIFFLEFPDMKSGSKTGAVIHFLFATLSGTIGCIFLVAAIAPSVASRFTDSLLYSTSKLKAPPRLIAPVRGMINNGKIEEAVEELTDILSEHPYDPVALLMLVEVLMDELKEYSKAEVAIRNFFCNKKIATRDEFVDLLMRYADCWEYLGEPAGAIPLFEQELGRKYPINSVEAIERRMNSIKSEGA